MRIKKAWATFLFNVPEVKKLALEADAAAALLRSGANWNGGAWNTSLAANFLWQLTGVALVSGDFITYRSAFILSLALLWEVEFDTLTLPESV